ncbi:uncharacterized protein LOC123311463 isoform X2 [Coccinella septempunctata]|uniref:uncharacterized protein LOC123311463 isoform X2 n=1 Tax=Coccinella septempunctata TaxID=41139 RepID=UPI001D07224E|nr:uncharacterized protein LOC123311463 isoform X2 [Coccinella septempunctata]
MSQVATYRDKRQVVAKPYAPGGCPIHVGKQKCGETQGLDIIMDFHKLYQEKMNEIDVSAGGDSLQEKVDLQEQWINDLTEQNKLLAKVIEELESETIGRVQQLEDKLNNAVKSLGEEDGRPLAEKKKKPEELQQDSKAVPPAEDELKKKNEENDQLKQSEILSEEEIQNHSMSKIGSGEVEQKDETKQVILPDVEVLKQPEEISALSGLSSKNLSLNTEADEELPDQMQVKDKVTSKVSSKSVHLIIENGKEESQIVEPEKDLTIDSELGTPPSLESLPVYATTDSVELLKKSPQVSQHKLKDNACICEDKDYWDELDKLKEENKMLREGGELQKLKQEVEEKMRRILELNEENRTLNDMINMLRTNQSSKKQKEPPSDSEPMSSDSDYCTGICELLRSPNKTPSSKRRASCREKCSYQHKEPPDPSQTRKLCVCREDPERGNDSPPFIDVYKREDKGKFISDSSSTVCNEEVCPCLNNFAPYYNQHRARGGNDTNNPCPAGTFPNFQYNEILDECQDSNCPNKDSFLVTQAIDTDAVNCGANEFALVCGNKSCHTQGCESFQGDLGPPMAQCDIGSCLNTTCGGEERLIDVKEFCAGCEDTTCPNKDYYPPSTQAYGQLSSGQNYVDQGQLVDFPITCTDDTCQVMECPSKFGNTLEPPSQSYAPAGSFPITCDDNSCQVAECSAKSGPMVPPESSYISQGYKEVSQYGTQADFPTDCPCVTSGQMDPNCPCMMIDGGANVNIPIQNAFAPQGLPRTPSICICGMPDECQMDAPPSGMPIDQQTSSFARPPTKTFDGKCPRGICDICACIQIPSTDGVPHSGVPPPAIFYGAQSTGGAGGRCSREICDTCACIRYPGVVQGGEPRPFPPSAGPPGYGGAKPPSDVDNEGFCAICGCELTASDMGVNAAPGSIQGTAPRMAQTPMGVQRPPGAADECLCVQQQPCICVETEKPMAPQTATYTTPTGVSAGTTGALEPLTTVPCPDEVCPEPCTCKVVPSEPYFDPDEPKPTPTNVTPVSRGGGGGECDPCDPCVCEEDEGMKGQSKPSPVSGVAPVTENICPDEICERPCTCKVVQSEEYIDSDTDIRKRQITSGGGMGEKPSGVVPSEVCSMVCPAAIANPSLQVAEKTSVACSAVCSEAIDRGVPDKPPEVCSVVCQAAIENPSLQITDKASVACSAICSEAIGDKPSVHVGEKPIGQPPSSTTDGVCGDSTCARRYPKGGSAGASVPQSTSRPPPPAGDDRMIIRCICKSKFCKVIPDPDNPNQKLCVDASDTNTNRRGSSCVCQPDCPEMGNTGETCSQGQSPYPKQAQVMTVNQLYKMPKTPESLSKEQEYAGLSRKDSFTRTVGYIAPRKASSRYGIQDDDEDFKVNDEMKNADLKLVIANLKSKLLDAEDKIEELKTGKNYSDKDNDTALISRYSEEINEMKKSLKWTKKEREEYEYLKQRVKLLEQGKGDTEHITSNLQTAVDLYVDTIELLESSERKLKTEIEQYRGVNETLHENILSMREEIENMKEAFQQEMDDQKWTNFVLHIENVDVQQTNQMYSEQIQKYQNLYQQLMELNYELEMEHVNNLQDLAIMESHFNKYQSIFKIQEEEKIVIRNQLRKLTKKNKCYEEVVKFFKDEMSVMSDELLTLQEVLNVTNVSSQEENNKLIGAILQLRRINDRLVGHLCAIEKQAILESQINQINEARINELQNIISAKNNDLTQHDDIIQDMRRKLNNATKQNVDLKKTIKNLTDTVVEIQEGIKSVEREQMKNLSDVSVVESKVCLASGDLEAIKTCMEQKNNRIVELENQLKSQEVELILATKELGVLKEKKTDSKELINSLKEQLSIAEKKNEQVIGDYQMVVKKLQDYSSLEHMKNYELNHYKSLVEEMKMSLIQLNNGLEKCEASNIHFYEDLRNSDHLRGRLQHRKNNLPIVFDELKKSMADLKRRLSEADFKGGLIEEELLKVKESHMSQIPEEITDTQKELEAKIISSIEEQSRLNQLVEDQKEEIQRLERELEKERADICCCKRSVSELKNEKTTSNAEMEISQLKCELNKSLHRQRLLNEENDQIHTQTINLRKKLSVLEQAYDVLKQENEDYKSQLKRTIREKEYLTHKNHDLARTIEQMRNTHEQLEKQCRTMMRKMSEEKSWIKMPMQQPFSPRRYGTVGQLERRAVSPARTRKLERHTADARYRSSSPRHEMNAFLNDEYLPEDSNSHRSNIVRNISYDSNSSPYTSRSPSPRSNSIRAEDDELDELNLNDWFSPNYKETDTDADEGEEENFINKVQLMTAQVQEANKRWQKKMKKEHVSKSRASNK